MGLALGPASSSESWAVGFKDGTLFLDDFLGDDWDPIITPLAVKRYKDLFERVPSRYIAELQALGVAV